MRLCKSAIDKKKQWTSEDTVGNNGENKKSEEKNPEYNFLNQ